MLCGLSRMKVIFKRNFQMMTEAKKMPYSDTRLLASRVLVFAPHPDDEIFGCGGALAKLCDGNIVCQIHICTDGSLGGVQQGSLGLIESRRLESQRAIAALQIASKASLHFWQFADRSLEQEPKLLQAISHSLARFKPDLVFAPSLMEVHPDHLAVAAAVFACWRSAQEDQSFDLCMYEIGRPIETNCLVDISSVIERKRQAMQCFESQLAERDYLGVIEGLNRYRSYTLGNHVIAAEAFFFLSKSSVPPPNQCHQGVDHLATLLPASMRSALEGLDHDNGSEG